VQVAFELLGEEGSRARSWRRDGQQARHGTRAPRHDGDSCQQGGIDGKSGQIGAVERLAHGLGERIFGL
jgi:hypothetical protein